MASSLRSLVLLCGICGLLAGVSCQTIKGFCPKGYTRLNDRCLIFEHEPRTFADAERVCNILGGNLVSIPNGVENAVIIELIRDGSGDDFKNTWNGYHDTLLEGNFVWSDGTAEDFTDFAPTQPDDTGNEDCVEIRADDEQWNDVDCTNENSFVCAIDVLKKH
ncbi:alpha-N-acetylgalactosamine-specific lectin-like [Syngnathoides biaculeatus]|uniref:alpha-N-acetylgalactosamine-specific lectin-like n=1 Tax=Syngnathoides biaculeatus TaxID=300417 RepID=UPI002ADD8AD7|nr:alpha-N-acetylgalactosamine-specific lectin-like [Syngnathoides biaculeatus]